MPVCCLPSAACAPADIPAYDQPAVLRVLPGPHSSAFTDAGLDTFFSGTYTVSPQSDRQGYRLSGPAVARTDAADLLSEAMPWGGIQVPPDGSPILLMADRQTTGGYPLVGVVLSADLLPAPASSRRATPCASRPRLWPRRRKQLAGRRTGCWRGGGGAVVRGQGSEAGRGKREEEAGRPRPYAVFRT